MYTHEIYAIFDSKESYIITTISIRLISEVLNVDGKTLQLKNKVV